MEGGVEGLGFLRIREGLKLSHSSSSSEISSMTRLMVRVRVRVSRLRFETLEMVRV